MTLLTLLTPLVALGTMVLLQVIEGRLVRGQPRARGSASQGHRNAPAQQSHERA